jgi:hypothetical protein
MNRALLSTLTAVAAFTLAPAAQAADFFPGDSNFTVSTDAETGDISAFIGNTVKFGTVRTPAAFTDTFSFIVDQSGLGSGSITTSTTAFLKTNNLDITSVFFNNIAADINRSPNGLFESFSLIGVPVFAGVENVITITGFSRGNGSYGGDITFSPAVPETGTWAMMIIGFGAVGAAMRYRRRQTKVAYAA